MCVCGESNSINYGTGRNNSFRKCRKVYAECCAKLVKSSDRTRSRKLRDKRIHLFDVRCVWTRINIFGAVSFAQARRESLTTFASSTPNSTRALNRRSARVCNGFSRRRNDDETAAVRYCRPTRSYRRTESKNTTIRVSQNDKLTE